MLNNSHYPPEQFVPDLDTSAVWTVRYIDPSGFEVQLSIEASTGTEAMRKGQIVIERLKETQCSPINRDNKETSMKEESTNSESFCPIHQVEMKQWEKRNKTWYSHKTPDGRWCNGGHR